MSESYFCYQCMTPHQTQLSVCPVCNASMPYTPKDPNDLLPGTVLHERYTVGKLIGRGGFGATYIAYDNLENKVCALKEYFPHKLCARTKQSSQVEPAPAQQDAYNHYLRSFLTEANKLTELRGVPGVVQVSESFEENGTAYFSMEYIEGSSLGEYVHYRCPNGMAPAEALAMCRDILRTLSAVHQRGILHRDISADNMMLTRKKELKMIDFGSARDMMQMQKTTFSKGCYTAPEQRYGDKQRACTDLYAVGVLLFYMLMGRVPSMSGIHLENLRAARKGLPEELYRLYETATAVNPNFRYQSADAMLQETEKVLLDAPLEAPRPKSRLSKNVRRYVILGVASALLLALLVLTIAGIGK